MMEVIVFRDSVTTLHGSKAQKGAGRKKTVAVYGLSASKGVDDAMSMFRRSGR